MDAPSDYDFRVKGKIGVVQAGKGNSARFDWRQEGGRYWVSVSGPLGQGRTQLEGDQARMEISRGEQVLAVGPPEQVMIANLGWSVPIDALSHWVMGRPDTQAVARMTRDEAARVQGFEQAGWRVSFDRYESTAADALPGRIKARAEDRVITVVVYSRE